MCPIVAAGRAHWKIQSKNHKVLKNDGYHLELNFDHGHHDLAQVLVLRNWLAESFCYPPNGGR